MDMLLFISFALLAAFHDDYPRLEELQVACADCTALAFNKLPSSAATFNAKLPTTESHTRLPSFDETIAIRHGFQQTFNLIRDAPPTVTDSKPQKPYATTAPSTTRVHPNIFLLAC
jgi:hypothetical protein